MSFQITLAQSCTAVDFPLHLRIRPKVSTTFNNILLNRNRYALNLVAKASGPLHIWCDMKQFKQLLKTTAVLEDGK